MFDAPYTVVETAAALAELGRTLADWRGRGPDWPIALDTETTGLDPLTGRLLMAQFGIPGQSWVVDCRRVSLHALGALVDGQPFVFQNGKFDLKWLAHHTGAWAKVGHDTMIAEQLLTAGAKQGVGLAALCARYLQVELEKETRKSFADVGDEPFSREQLVYAVRDVQVLFPIMEEQQAKLAAAGLTSVDRLERAVTAVTARMELTGVLVDQARWRALLAQAEPLRDQYALELALRLGRGLQLGMFLPDVPTINADSPAQVLKAFRAAGIPLEDTQDHTLQRHAEEPAVASLLKYRSQQKLLTSFGEGLLAKINPQTGRFHTDLKPLGTDTGRFSASNPNLQQIPSGDELRSCFIAPPGSSLVACDYSGQELRILAQLSGDVALAAAFAGGKNADVHRSTAALMFDVPIGAVSKAQRQGAKAINFGLIYGRGPRALSDQLKVSEDEARALIDRYFAAYPGVAAWIRQTRAAVHETGESRTILGRRRLLPVPDVLDPDYRAKRGSIERRATNTPIQGTGGDMVKLALLYINEALPEGARTILTVHDEILVECRDDRTAEVKDLVEAMMRKAGSKLVPDVPIEVGSAVATSWTH